MRRSMFLITVVLIFQSSCSKKSHTYIQNEDVVRFWRAYDRIASTSDSVLHYKILQEEYINKGSEGLLALMQKKNYTPDSYINAINAYPSFWNSIRANTLKSDYFAKEIEENIHKLKKLYPDLKPAQVFFTIGALYTGGTAHDGHVLIGAEIAMADSNTVTQDISPDWLRDNLHNYFHSNPIDDIVLLNVHEYVHTQQGSYGTDLLSMCIYEGIAEFVSVLASNKPSVAPAIPYGNANNEVIRDRFQKEMFSPHWNGWLYNNRENEFGVRDLGYYVGYEICQRYYDKAQDKRRAIKEIVELDCANEKDVLAFLEASDYLSEPYEALKEYYVKQKPKVIGLKEFSNNANDVYSNIETVTIQFSKPMNPRFKNFKLGDLGEGNLLPYKSVKWSDSNQSLILGVDLEGGKRYQIIVDDEFRDMEGRVVDRYLIEFETVK